MLKNLLYFVTLYILIFLIGNTAQAASFVCSSVHSTLETLICADSELSDLDKRQAESYHRLQALAPQKHSELLMQQRKFLKERTTACPIPFKPALSEEDTHQTILCLKGFYTLRLNQLNSAIAEIVPGSSQQIPILSSSIEANKNEDMSSCKGPEVHDYYVLVCSAKGMELAGKSEDFLSNISGKIENVRTKLACSPDSVEKIFNMASAAAGDIVSSGVITPLMDFSDAINLECNKKAAETLK